MEKLGPANVARSILTSFCANIGLHTKLKLEKHKLRDVLILSD